MACCHLETQKHKRVALVRVFVHVCVRTVNHPCLQHSQVKAEVLDNVALWHK